MKVVYSQARDQIFAFVAVPKALIGTLHKNVLMFADLSRAPSTNPCQSCIPATAMPILRYNTACKALTLQAELAAGLYGHGG